MHIPAQRFLRLRAIGAPAVVVSLAIQGIFRGFKDTKTPVLCLGKWSLFAQNIIMFIPGYFWLLVILYLFNCPQESSTKFFKF